jgi:hypothetical protein
MRLVSSSTLRWIAVFVLAGLGSASSLSADSIAASRSYVPLVHTRGDTGEWRTDLSFFNPEPERTVTVDVLYAPEDTDGTNASGSRFTLPPRTSYTFKDVLCNAEIKFNYCAGFGVADIHAFDPAGEVSILVTSNTYNIAGGRGTYGQFVPALAARKALGYSESVFGDLYCPGLPFGSNIRVNAAVINPTEFTLSAMVWLTDRTGAKLPLEFPVSVKPYSMNQVNDIYGAIFASAGPFDPDKAPYRLTFFVKQNNGARILAYATVTDTDTGDPYLITAEPMRP